MKDTEMGVSPDATEQEMREDSRTVHYKWADEKVTLCGEPAVGKLLGTFHLKDAQADDRECTKCRAVLDYCKRLGYRP